MKKIGSAAGRIESTSADSQPVRTRIIYAAIAAFLDRGYTNVSMLDIATSARVSNRDLYAMFKNKLDLLAQCVASRAQRMKQPEGLPAITDERSLTNALVLFGSSLLSELTDREVLLLYYLAIVECWRAPEIAKTLDKFGRQATQNALARILKEAQAKDLIEDGDADELANEYLALLMGHLLLKMLLRLAERPTRAAMQRRAIGAADAFLKLHR